MFLLLGVVSCSKKESYETFKDQHLSPKTAFTAQQGDYYVYFYKEDCRNCTAVKDLIFAQAKDKEMPLYFINEKDVAVVLNRTKDRDYNNYGATSFNEIYIYGYPTVFLIRNGRIIAQFIGSGEITKELSS